MAMTETERTMLDDLAKADSRSAADWIRLAIARAHADKFGTKKLRIKK